MSRFVNETPDLRWFHEMNFDCRQCGKRADGELMGIRNENYGLHCNRCATKRLKESKAVREAEAALAKASPQDNGE